MSINLICDHCEYWGNKFQYHAKKRTCINPDSQYNGCKRYPDKSCKAFTIRSDGRSKGPPVEWYKANEADKF